MGPYGSIFRHLCKQEVKTIISAISNVFLHIILYRDNSDIECITNKKIVSRKRCMIRVNGAICVNYFLFNSSPTTEVMF